MLNYDDPDIEEKWCGDRRLEVASYLNTERVEHGQVGEWPAWHLAPYVSVWAIESKEKQGWVGWWVLCGDLPTDYVSAESIKHPREAIRSIAKRWLSAAEHMAWSEELEGLSIGPASKRTELATLLLSRAHMLETWATDDALW